MQENNEIETNVEVQRTDNAYLIVECPHCKKKRSYFVLKQQESLSYSCIDCTNSFYIKSWVEVKQMVKTIKMRKNKDQIVFSYEGPPVDKAGIPFP